MTTRRLLGAKQPRLLTTTVVSMHGITATVLVSSRTLTLRPLEGGKAEEAAQEALALSGFLP